ncbi:MAG: DUF342 domain-containing protein [Deferribacterales bacterium]
MDEKRDMRGQLFDDLAYKEQPSIEISDDLMSATLIVPDDPLYVDVFSLIAESGVYVGIDTELVKEINAALLTGKKTERAYVIARGKKAVSGQNGELILRTVKPADMILSSEDITNVDYRVYKQKQLALAEKDQPVAMIISPTKGRDGMTVTGEPIDSLDGLEVELDLGKNVYINGKKLVSSIDGLIEYSKVGNRIKFDISEVYLIKGDVDFSTGNIDFPGSVIVKGSIKAGFEVKARNEVVATTIRGKVTAGGGVTARQGIIGGQLHAEIFAGGSIFAKFMHKAKVISGDSVMVKKSIMYSEVYAENEVAVESAPGSIIGGKTFAVNGISAKILGSESYVKTDVSIFSSVHDVLDMKKFVAERYELSKTLIKLETYLGNNKEVLMRQGEEKRAMIDKLLKKREQLRKEIVIKDAELKLIQQKLTEKSDGRIHVGKTVFPEVKCMIGGRFYLVKEESSKGTFSFSEEDQEINYNNEK